MYDRPFKWWVQSVMPVVFDDSLSYYEVLAKLTKYIEGLTGDVDQIEKILGTIEGIEDVTQFTEMLENIQSEIGNLANLSTQTKTDLVSAINEIALKADIAYYKPPTGIPESDLSQSVQDKLNKTVSATEYIINNVKLKPSPSNNSPADLGLGTYSVPYGGIPWDTLSQDVKDRIESGSGGEGGTKDYTDLNNKPQINGHTLNAGNNTAESLGLGTYSKPGTGIPESDLSAQVQEKLNTSGGIADSETSFVATRDYEAGELIYINGVLYKTKYKILSGTNLIPGNNIEVTDISNEIERINSDIDALQSGSGPDSWNLSAEVKSESSTEITNFFEYFNCIGGENYNFILDPVEPTVGYAINIYKRDGTSVRAFDNTTYPNYLNRQRFTFTPTDTGKYYCTIRRSTASGAEIAHARVTIEYTQSQGISELWNKVNEASQLEPRVGAVETLVEEQQTQTDYLKSAISDVTGNRIINMLTNTAITNSAGALSETPFVVRAGSNCALIECSEGDVFVINGTSGVTYRLWAFFDSTKTLLSVSTANATGNNTVITAPQNSAYLAINDLSGAGLSYYNILLQNRMTAVENDLELVHTLNEQTASTIGILSIEPVGEWVYGYYISTKGLNNIASSVNTPNMSETWAYAIIACAPYDIFTASGNSGTRPEAVVFVDANYNVLARYVNGRYIRKVFQAPPESAYIVINCSVSNVSTIFKGVPSLKQYGLNNLTVNLTGTDNEMWSWWIYPQVISFKGVRNHLYWTYTTHDGYCGVACYDFSTKQVTKTHLKNGQIDDHNAPAIICLEDGTIVVGYAEGHNLDPNMHIRISETPECIERFKDDIIVPSSGVTAYCQFISYSGTLYMFYRVNDTNWAYRYSTDGGNTWSTETILITSTMKYYCKFVPTSTSGVVRIVMYSNPTSGDSNIRQGFLHLDTLSVYNSDNTTVLGNSGLAYTLFSIIVPTEQSLNLNRLLDVAITDPQRPLILYCTFHGANDGVYKIYDGGTITTVIISGTDIFPAYQLGASWIGSDKILLSRGSGGTDFIEIWNYSSSTATFSETVYSESRGLIPIRNFRPIVDVNGEACLWLRGFYDARNYTNYNTDAKLYLLD